jgi:tight adherence protein B
VVTAGLGWSAWTGLGLVCAALLCAGFVLLAPRPVRLPVDRRRPDPAADPSALSGAAAAATSLVSSLLRRRGRSRALTVALEGAGVAMPAQDVVLLVGVGVLVGGALGVVLAGPLLGLLLALLVPVLAKVALDGRTRRRQQAFAEQLDDSLQLMASSLRAGHSLLQALAAVASEAELPTSVEFTRIINETRVGRPLGEALEEAAGRMRCDDFVWVTQAVAINREVGGNLAEVLDGVSGTIRERNQIRRQVRALAAEGKLSALVLMVLPFGVGGFLLMSNPGYLAKFTASVVGYGLLLAAVVLLVTGALWLRKTVQVKF